MAGLPDDAIVLVSTFHRDSAGKDFASRDVIARIAEESRVPVYGVLESLIGTGVVGGHMLSSALDGEKAARLALRVLAGDRPGPPVPGGTVHIFDWWQLQRWGLDERQLPAGSVLRFRQPSLWEAYRWHVVAVVLIVLAQSALIAGLLVLRHRRRQAERARLQAVEQAQRARDELAHTLRVTTLGGLVAAIAHEISQPLDRHRDERRGDAPDRASTARRRTRPARPWPTSRRMPCGPRRSSSGCERSAARSAASLARSISSG